MYLYHVLVSLQKKLSSQGKISQLRKQHGGYSAGISSDHVVGKSPKDVRYNLKTVAFFCSFNVRNSSLETNSLYPKCKIYLMNTCKNLLSNQY